MKRRQLKWKVGYMFVKKLHVRPEIYTDVTVARKACGPDEFVVEVSMVEAMHEES